MKAFQKSPFCPISSFVSFQDCIWKSRFEILASTGIHTFPWVHFCLLLPSISWLSSRDFYKLFFYSHKTIPHSVFLLATFRSHAFFIIIFSSILPWSEVNSWGCMWYKLIRAYFLLFEAEMFSLQEPAAKFTSKCNQQTIAWLLLFQQILFHLQRTWGAVSPHSGLQIHMVSHLLWGGPYGLQRGLGLQRRSREFIGKYPAKFHLFFNFLFCLKSFKNERTFNDKEFKCFSDFVCIK